MSSHDNQSNALIEHSSSGERYEVQELLIAAARRYPGYTATQVAWMLYSPQFGGYLDDAGYCQPASLFNAFNKIFNAKRRASEICVDADQAAVKYRAKLIYGAAVNNPYSFGGQGLYVRDGVDVSDDVNRHLSKMVDHDAGSAGEGAVKAVQEGGDSKSVNVAEKVYSLKSLLD